MLTESSRALAHRDLLSLRRQCWSMVFLATVLIGAPVVAQPAPQDAEDRPTSKPLRVVTYNIKHGQGNDGRVDLERVAEVLRPLQPDVVALQEIDREATRSGDVDQMQWLGDRLEMRSGFGPFMDFQGGQYGLGILSRFPVEHLRVERLPDGNEPRVALAMQVRRPDGSSVTVVDVHFDWVGDDEFRFAQAQHVAKFLDTLQTPYILMGDFNDRPGSRTLELFQSRALEAAKPEDDPYTFASDDPRIEIDFIFAAPREAWKVGEVRVIDEPLASDHRPVLAELTLVDAGPSDAGPSDADTKNPQDFDPGEDDR